MYVFSICLIWCARDIYLITCVVHLYNIILQYLAVLFLSFLSFLLFLWQMFLEVIPRFLGMTPVDEGEEAGGMDGVRERRRSSFGLMQRAEEYVLKQPRSEMMFDKQRERHGLTRSFGTRFYSDHHFVLDRQTYREIIDR